MTKQIDIQSQGPLALITAVGEEGFHDSRESIESRFIFTEDQWDALCEASILASF